MSDLLTTCPTCEWTWDARTWTRCPRCMGTLRAYEPNASEIRVACEAIQRTWSPAVRWSRCCGAYRTTEYLEIELAHGGPDNAQRDYLDRD